MSRETGSGCSCLGFLLTKFRKSWRTFRNTDVAEGQKCERDPASQRRAGGEQAKLVVAVEQAAEEILITDTEGNIQYCNPFFEQASGYSRVEAMGRNPRFLKSGKHDAEFYRVLWDTVKAGRPWTGRITNRKKDGSFYELDGSISPLHDPSGELTGFVSVRHDVTERRQLESQLRRAQKMDSIARLARGVAHDFNNLLTVVLGCSTALQEMLLTGDRRWDQAEHIRKAAERGADLTQQLLTFARKQILQAKPLDLNQVITEIQELLQQLAGNNTEVAITLAPSLGCILADAGQMRQVLMNLVAHARDAMPQGGKLTITTKNVELKAKPGTDAVVTRPSVLLSVSDTGTGIEEEIRQHIFEPFFSSEQAGRGTGLGLSTVYGIVQHGGGQIEVESDTSGGGTTFYIWFPRVEGIAPSTESQAAAASQSSGSHTLLLVEDQDQVRFVITEMLMASGFHVLSAASGETALLTAQQYDGKIDLLVTDVIMPGMTGKQLADKLAGIRPGIKVLYISGYSGDILAQQGCLESGVAYLSKPFSAAALKAKVQESLNSAEPQGPAGRK